ncbi:hypothetical protein [Comamonas odontotermitis]|uniref:hypothetical protein n=1 Tax=Comamonas odontotermitis TaxID=379895 RepID=UPI003750E156
MQEFDDKYFDGDARLASGDMLFSSIFPGPASTTAVYNEIAKRLGLVHKDEFISEDLLRFAAVVVEKCARASDDPDYIRRTLLPDSIEDAKRAIAIYNKELAEYLRSTRLELVGGTAMAKKPESDS